MILPSYSQILKDLTLNEDQYKVMVWGHEMRLFNMNKDLHSNNNSNNNKNGDYSTVISEPRSHNFNSGASNENQSILPGTQNLNMKDSSKIEIWFQFLREEISLKEPFFLDLIKGMNSRFYEKHHKISETNETSAYQIIFKEFEKLKEFLFDVIICFYQDFARKIIVNLKSKMGELYEEIRNTLDEMFFASEFCFYPLLMTIINISSIGKQMDLEFELRNPLNLDLNYLEFDSNFQKLFTPKIYEESIVIFKELKKRRTPKGKYEQIVKIKEFLMKECFEKALKMNGPRKMRIDPDQIITMFVYIICGSQDTTVINDMILMEELLSYRWKETNINSYFYVAFKTSIHFLLKKGRDHNKKHETFDSNESIFKV